MSLNVSTNFLKYAWDTAMVAGFTASYIASQFIDASVPHDPFTAEWTTPEIVITGTGLVALGCLTNQIHRLGIGTHSLYPLIKSFLQP